MGMGIGTGEIAFQLGIWVLSDERLGPLKRATDRSRTLGIIFVQSSGRR